MEKENVVQMPTLLDRLWGKLKTCLTQEATNRGEWIAIQETKCATLVEIRDQFAADIAFGQACKDNGFDTLLNHQDRAAAIAMGRDPKALSACLKATTRSSLQHIFREEFSRFTHVSKPTTRRTAPPKPATTLRPDLRKNTTPQAEAAAKVVLDEGKSYGEAQAQTGLSSTVVRSAVAREEGRREAIANPVIVLTDLSMSAQQKLETAIRQHQKKLDLEFTERVRVKVLLDTEARLKWMKEKEDWANKIIASHKGVFSKEEFRKIRACLHPDVTSYVHAAEMLQLFSKHERVLVKPELPKLDPGTPPLPSFTEMMAMRDKVSAQRRAKAAARKAASPPKQC